jgi:hypothetical protein
MTSHRKFLLDADTFVSAHRQYYRFHGPLKTRGNAVRLLTGAHVTCQPAAASAGSEQNRGGSSSRRGEMIRWPLRDPP